MKRTKSNAKSPLVRLVGWHDGIATAAIVTTGLMGAAAQAAPGDLDPSFGDLGRWFGVNLNGPLWSLDVQDNDAIAFAGGEEYCYYGCDLTDFTGRLLPNGTLDPGFAAASLAQTVVYDTALQGDGKLVGVGSALGPNGVPKLRVFRLLPNGSLDAGFGGGGLVLIGDATGTTEAARSVIVEPGGRIVVAGNRGSNLLVARLLADGALDPAFGTGGVYVGPERSYLARVVRAPGGGYRVMASWFSRDCTVSGLTEAGTLDAGFGNGGVAVASATAECSSLAMDATGRLLVGGRSQADNSGGIGYVARLLPNGTLDPGLSAAPISAQFSEVTALAVGPTGSVFAAGRERIGFTGATVVRLRADGTVDPLYGRAGSSRIELTAPRSSNLVINDMQALRDDALVVGGSRGDTYFWTPFVTRLVGNAGGSPGVLSMERDEVLGVEKSGQATVTVRRIGGSRGAIAVSYTARDLAGTQPKASKGADYTAIAGRLTWADGDGTDRQVVVPLATDTLEESPEFFELALENPEGGAGLGAHGTTIAIADQGYPSGLLSIWTGEKSVDEGELAYFEVKRDPYAVGVVTVTLRVAAATAEGGATPGKDFASEGAGNAWRDVVVTFQDNQRSALVAVPTLRDGKKEGPENITLELVSPTGGATIGDQTMATVTIMPAGGGSSGGGSGGGGGTFGWLAALLLGLGGGLRRLVTFDGRQRG